MVVHSLVMVIYSLVMVVKGANNASRVRVQLSSSQVVNIWSSSSSRAYSSQARLDSLTFRVELELELESSLLESSFDRIESE